MTTISVSTETLKQLNCKIDEFSILLKSLTPKDKDTPELIITYHEPNYTYKKQQFYKLNNMIHGKYKEYYENGRIKCIYGFNRGQKQGFCIDYNKDKSIKKIGYYINGNALDMVRGEYYA